MIWIFGDSYSANFDNALNGPWANEYINYKGYVPKTFDIFLSEQLNHENKNLAIPGGDNDSIFEKILKNAPLIQKDDIVIIGWTHIVRFRVSISEAAKNFLSILPNKSNQTSYIDLSQDTVDEILVNRTSAAYFEEFKIRFNFINWLFRDNILIQWTVHEGNLLAGNMHEILNFTKSNLNNISQETNGIVRDLHYSEAGHKQLTDDFITLIGDNELRLKNNRIGRNKLI